MAFDMMCTFSYPSHCVTDFSQVMTRLQNLKVDSNERGEQVRTDGVLPQEEDGEELDLDDCADLDIDIPSLLGDVGGPQRITLPDGETVVVTFRIPGGSEPPGPRGSRPSSLLRSRYETIDEERESMSESEQGSHMGESGTTADNELSDDSYRNGRSGFTRENNNPKSGSDSRKTTRRKKIADKRSGSEVKIKGDTHKKECVIATKNDRQSRECDIYVERPHGEESEEGQKNADADDNCLNKGLSRWDYCLDLHKPTSAHILSDYSSSSSSISLFMTCQDGIKGRGPNDQEDQLLTFSEDEINPEDDDWGTGCDMFSQDSSDNPIRSSFESDRSRSGEDIFKSEEKIILESLKPTIALPLNTQNTTNQAQSCFTVSLGSTKPMDSLEIPLPNQIGQKRNYQAFGPGNKALAVKDCLAPVRVSSKPTDLDAVCKETFALFTQRKSPVDLVDADSRSLPFLATSGRPTDLDSVSSNMLAFCGMGNKGGFMSSSSPSLPVQDPSFQIFNYEGPVNTGLSGMSEFSEHTKSADELYDQDHKANTNLQAGKDDPSEIIAVSTNHSSRLHSFSSGLGTDLDATSQSNAGINSQYDSNISNTSDKDSSPLSGICEASLSCSDSGGSQLQPGYSNETELRGAINDQCKAKVSRNSEATIDAVALQNPSSNVGGLVGSELPFVTTSSKIPDIGLKMPKKQSKQTEDTTPSLKQNNNDRVNRNVQEAGRMACDSTLGEAKVSITTNGLDIGIHTHVQTGYSTADVLLRPANPNRLHNIAKSASGSSISDGVNSDCCFHIPSDSDTNSTNDESEVRLLPVVCQPGRPTDLDGVYRRLLQVQNQRSKNWSKLSGSELEANYIKGNAWFSFVDLYRPPDGNGKKGSMEYTRNNSCPTLLDEKVGIERAEMGARKADGCYKDDGIHGNINRSSSLTCLRDIAAETSPLKTNSISVTKQGNEGYTLHDSTSGRITETKDQYARTCDDTNELSNNGGSSAFVEGDSNRHFGPIEKGKGSTDRSSSKTSDKGSDTCGPNVKWKQGGDTPSNNKIMERQSDRVKCSDKEKTILPQTTGLRSKDGGKVRRNMAESIGCSLSRVQNAPSPYAPSCVVGVSPQPTPQTGRRGAPRVTSV